MSITKGVNSNFQKIKNKNVEIYSGKRDIISNVHQSVLTILVLSSWYLVLIDVKDWVGLTNFQKKNRAGMTSLD